MIECIHILNTCILIDNISIFYIEHVKINEFTSSKLYFLLAVFFDRVYVAYVFILLDQDVKPSCE